jgi:hypothetical protein
MARKTFGRTGQSIVVDDGEAGQSSQFVIVSESSADDRADEPIRIADDGDIEPASEADGDGDGARAGKTYTDPATATAPKRRGRPKGYKNKPKIVENIGLITANLEKVLFNLHVMGAGLLHEPDLAIDEDEAKLLANAVAQVATAYDFKAVLSQKAQAAIDMSIALATVYGPRVVKIATRPKQRRAATNVVSMSDKTASQ